MELLHHGAHQGVTGSCHELRLGQGQSILVDCGLFQGDGQADDQSVNFYGDHIQALLVTHAHIDHIGRIPSLIQAGFRKPIYCTYATAALLPIMLEDAIRIGITRKQSVIRSLLRTLADLIRPCSFGAWLPVDGVPKLAFRFLQAGHILGSASIEVHCQDQRIVFSGDLGCRDTPLLTDPEIPEYADLLVLESTYGDRLHEARATRQDQLKSIVERCITNRGAILIPAFAIGRTQELLYEIEDLIQRHPSWQDMVIILDSPLAQRVTEAYDDWQQLWDCEATKRVTAGRSPLDFRQLKVIGEHADHLRLVEYIKTTAAPCIVIAGSGMCQGGRIKNYLRELLPDTRTDVLFVGYQAHGSLGRAIQNCQPGDHVSIDRESVEVAAGIYTLTGYSAHADQAELIAYVGAMPTPPAEIKLVHGDAEAKKMLAQQLREHFSSIVAISN